MNCFHICYGKDLHFITWEEYSEFINSDIGKEFEYVYEGYRYNFYDVCLNTDVVLNVIKKHFRYYIEISKSKFGWHFGIEAFVNLEGHGTACAGVPMKAFKTKEDAILKALNDIIFYYRKCGADDLNVMEAIKSAEKEMRSMSFLQLSIFEV